jgi:2-succinyl-6-hydroxy-2,4-cyclohexadiene-1-carboxylate synthase
MKGTLWCLHGAVGMAADWQGFSAPGWAAKRVDLWRFLDCCPMSLPGFGRALNTEALAEPGRKILVAYSMGARLALHSLIQGGPWDAAVLISPHPGLGSEADRAARRTTDAEWASLALSGDWQDFLARWESQPVLAGKRFPADRRSLSARRREVARSFIDWSLGAQAPLWDRLGGISCPVLWCVGEQDLKFQALGERAVPLLPQGELWVAPAAGHRLPWDAPEAFRAKLGEFLERVAG